jgi:hypothetical protein
MKRTNLCISIIVVALAQEASANGLMGMEFDYNLSQSGSSVTPTSFDTVERALSEGTPTFSSVSVTLPNNNVDTLAETSGDPGYFIHQSANYSSLTSFNAAYGLGSYMFKGVDSNSNSLSATIPNNFQAFSTTPAEITNDSALQTYDINHSLTVDFTTFTPNPNATNTEASATVIDPSVAPNDELVSVSGDASLDSFTIPSGTLDPNKTYDLEIIQENDINGPTETNFDDLGSQIIYDTITIDQFTTENVIKATPDPAPLVMMTVGLAGLYLRRRRK